VHEDGRPREQVENHGRDYLVPSAGQKIPVQPGRWKVPQKILLAENRFLQTRKGELKMQRKNPGSAFTVDVQLLRLKVHTVCRFCTFARTRYALIRNSCAEFGQETRMFDRDTIDLSKTLFALGCSCPLSSHAYACIGDSFLHPLTVSFRS